MTAQEGNDDRPILKQPFQTYQSSALVGEQEFRHPFPCFRCAFADAVPVQPSHKPVVGLRITSIIFFYGGTNPGQLLV